MKKTIYTIVAVGFISSMLANSAFAGDRHMAAKILNPFWLPVAIATSVAATVATITQPPVVYERREYVEPRQTVIYEEPRHYGHDRYYDRRPADYRCADRERVYEAPRYREYREYR